MSSAELDVNSASRHYVMPNELVPLRASASGSLRPLAFGGLPRRHTRQHLLHLRPPQRQRHALHSEAGIPLRGECIPQDPYSGGQDIALDRNDSLSVPKRFPVNRIRLAEHRGQPVRRVPECNQIRGTEMILAHKTPHIPTTINDHTILPHQTP